MSNASRYMARSLLLKNKVISDFVGKAKLIEEDSVGKIHFSINKVTKQYSRTEIDYLHSFVPPR